MLKVVAIIALVAAANVGAGNVMAAEMSMPAGGHTLASNGSGETETVAAATCTDASATGAMHEAATHDSGADGVTTAHDRMQPDSAAVTRTISTHAALGADAGSSTGAPPHKNRHSAHWQSLLPGVMK